MPLLAESLDGAFALMFGVPMVAFALTLFSFWPSARGHWSGPLLASPSIIIGCLFAHFLATAQRKDTLMPGLWQWAIVPIVVGMLSVCLWFVRRTFRGGHK